MGGWWRGAGSSCGSHGEGGSGGRWGGSEGLGVAVAVTVRVAGVMSSCRCCCGRRQWRCWCGGREASTWIWMRRREWSNHWDVWCKRKICFKSWDRFWELAVNKDRRKLIKANHSGLMGQYRRSIYLNIPLGHWTQKGNYGSGKSWDRRGAQGHQSQRKWRRCCHSKMEEVCAGQHGSPLPSPQSFHKMIMYIKIWMCFTFWC